jgi:ATP-binding protein involved in chromosome partitioning
MKLDRKEILKALERLKNMVERAVTNVVTLAMRLLLTWFCIPAMHIKKRAEDDIKKNNHDLVSPEAKVKVNTKVEAVAESPNQIKGKSIPGVKKYNCRSLR